MREPRRHAVSRGKYRYAEYEAFGWFSTIFCFRQRSWTTRLDSLRGFVSFLWLALRTLGASPDHAARRTPDPHHIRGAPAEHRRARPSSPRCGGLVTTDSFVASMITSHPSRSPDSPADEPILRTSHGTLPEKPEPSFGTIAVASNLTLILLPHACCAPAQLSMLSCSTLAHDYARPYRRHPKP